MTSDDPDDDALFSYAISEEGEVPAGFGLSEDGSYTFDPTLEIYEHLNVGDREVITIPRHGDRQ